MNTPTITSPVSPSPTLEKVDRVGIVASVLCAIHCAIAPILLIALPTFGKVWAHPASHILVAIFVVPIAAFSIRKGYQTHGRRWVAIVASIGILFVLIGAALPAFSKGLEEHEPALVGAETGSEGVGPMSSSAGGSESECAEENCTERGCSEGGCGSVMDEGEAVEAVGCVDACCPSLQVD